MSAKPKVRKSNPNALPSVISIAMVLLMVGLFLLMAFGAKKVSDTLRETVVLEVHLKHDVSNEQALGLKKELEARAEIKEVKYTDKETAAKNFSEELGQDFVTSLGYNPLPASFDILLHSESASQTTMSKLKVELSASPMVEEVFYLTSLLEQIEKNSRLILSVIVALSLIFLLIAVTLINSTIRLDLYSRRFLIRSMKLVGATRWFIIRPFLWKSILNGIYGWIIGSLLLAGVIYLLITWIPEVVHVIKPEELAIIAAFIFVFGVLLTMICSFFATRKYLKIKLEDLY